VNQYGPPGDKNLARRIAAAEARKIYEISTPSGPNDIDYAKKPFAALCKVFRGGAETDRPVTVAQYTARIKEALNA